MLSNQLIPRSVERLLLIAGILDLAVASCPRRPAPRKSRSISTKQKSRPYTLPDPLVMADGSKVTTREEWISKRRPELIRIFEDQVYGKVPQPPQPVRPTFHILSEDKEALGGTAIRREIHDRVPGQGRRPADRSPGLSAEGSRCATGRVPAFLGLNFEGNHTIHSDPGISLAHGWVPNNPEHGVTDHRAAESTRGATASRWQVERVLSHGYALATAYYGDIDPDFDDGFQNGVQPLFYSAGQTRPAANEWGSIAAWAWGLSRCLDALETVPEIDARQVVLRGPLAAGQDRPVGGSHRPSVCDRDLQRIRLRRGRALAAELRRDRLAHQHELPALVLHQLSRSTTATKIDCRSTSTS